MENSDMFGWQVAAEVHRRGLDRAKRKACVCDGQAYNWSIYEMHLLPLGLVPILDFVHLLAYLYDAAHAYRGKDLAQGWKTYEQWLRWAWSGKVGQVLSSLRAATAELAKKGSAAADRKKVPGKWVIKNTRSSVDPFLTYSTRRDLREKAWRMFVMRGDSGDEHDNNALIAEILKLRNERVGLLGYENYASWRLQNRMAKTPERARRRRADARPVGPARAGAHDPAAAPAVAPGSSPTARR